MRQPRTNGPKKLITSLLILLLPTWSAAAPTVIDATNLAVAPGFINMLSWSTDSLIVDGRSQGELRQGVTTEIFGEGESMGPLNAEMKKRMLREQGDIKFDIKWTSLAEYLRYLES